jgi:hypothetical protein
MISVNSVILKCHQSLQSFTSFSLTFPQLTRQISSSNEAVLPVAATQIKLEKESRGMCVCIFHSPTAFLGVKSGQRVGLRTLPPSMSRMSQNVGASTSRNPKGLHSLYRDNFAFTFLHYIAGHGSMLYHRVFRYPRIPQPQIHCCRNLE